jgi:hypothetical protein
MSEVQGLELILLSAGILLAVAVMATQVARRPTDHPLGRVLLGLVPAIIAVVLIVIDRLDVVPDDIEGPVWIVAIVLVSGLLILGTTYRLARH